MDSKRVPSFIHEVSWSDLPDSVRRAAKRSLLDLLGTLTAGSTTVASQHARDVAVQLFKDGPALLAFDGRTLSPIGAAFANGTTLDSMDAHDGHRLAKGHAGAGVFAAALAHGQTHPLDGTGFLTTMTVGYEVGLRAAMALHASASAYHSSGAWVALAAAAVAARTMALDERRTQEALGIAEYHGPRSPMMRCIDHPTMVKDGTGWGALTGLFAAELASQGFTGAPAELVESEKGDGLWSDLGQEWRILETYYKLYPCCRWSQPAVQAALDLQSKHGFTAEEIRRVRVKTFEAAIHLDHPNPRTTEQAQYSLSYPLAVALLTGDLTPADVQAPALEQPERVRLANRIELGLDEELERAFPEQALARVVITLADGRRLASAVHAAPGDPASPLSDQTLRAKYRRYARPLLGPSRADQLEAAALKLEEQQDLSTLYALLREPVAELAHDEPGGLA